jgi:arylmalonate decarboxylase
MSDQKRIGVILPASNVVVEPDFYRAVPPGVTVHAARFAVPSVPYTPEGLKRMDDEIVTSARYLAEAKVDAIGLIVLHSTVSHEGESAKEMERRVGEAAGVPVIRTSSSAMMALRALGAKRVTLGTPYSSYINNSLTAGIRGAGMEVASVAPDDRLVDGPDETITAQSPDDIVEFGVGACSPEADAMFFPCNLWHVFDAADRIEQRLGKIVVTASQATLWRCLRVAGVESGSDGWGRLLATMPPLPS